MFKTKSNSVFVLFCSMRFEFYNIVLSLFKLYIKHPRAFLVSSGVVLNAFDNLFYEMS